MTEHDDVRIDEVDPFSEPDDRRERTTEPPSAPDALEAILSAGRAVMPPTAEIKFVDDGLRTPEVWCSELKVPAWLHAMARQLHGWHEHEHHAGSPLRLSRAAYLDALNAANETDPKRIGKPSMNAKSPHLGKGL